MTAEAPVSVDPIDSQTHPESSSPLTPKNGNSRIKRRRSRRWWVFPLAVIPLAVGATLRQVSRPSEPVLTSAPLPVEVVSLTAVDGYTAARQYTGELVAGRRSNLGFDAGGTVVELLVDEGDRVAAGQPLARLDTRSLATQRQQLVAQKDQATAVLNELQNGPRAQDIAAARAAVADLEQQVALARVQRDRRKDLYSRGAISQEELDQETFGTGALENRLAQANSELDELLAGTRSEQIDAQAAQVRQLDASIQAVDVDLSKSMITAPFGGRISQRLVDEGVVVSGGQAVLQVVEAGDTEARVGVPAEVANGLAIGSAQTVAVGDHAFPATITALLPELDAASRTTTVVLTVNTDGDLTLGQTAQLTLANTQPAAGFWVPSTALVQGEQGLWSLYVAKAGETPNPAQAPAFTVAPQPVEILHTEGDRVLVQGLVQPGDQVIAAGTHRVVPGQVVSIAE
ncbi:MAG: efflux RND transporter periplasmic adaptor subunit [Nodosilinea sp.]